MRPYLIISCVFLILFLSCQKEDDVNKSSLCSNEELLAIFTTPEGDEIFIYEDGKLFTNKNGTCNFELQYFEPDFLEKNYVTNSSGTFLKNSSDLFPIKNNFIEDFENISVFTNLFINSINDTDLYWTNFTVQSPAAPTVSDYTALSSCILDGTCSFIDKK